MIFQVPIVVAKLGASSTRSERLLGDQHGLDMGQLAGWLAGWLGGWLAGCLPTGWLAGVLAGWLAGCWLSWLAVWQVG